MTRPGGDPASCSQLGGALRRQSELVGTLAQAPEALPAARTIAGRLDSAGAALQRYATELAEVHDAVRSIGAEVTASGLELDGWTVVEPWGPTTAEIAGRRRAAMRSAQERLDAVRAQMARCRASLERTAAAVTEALAADSAHLRTELGAGPDTLRS